MNRKTNRKQNAVRFPQLQEEKQRKDACEKNKTMKKQHTK